MKQLLLHSGLRKFICYPLVIFGLCLIADDARSEIIDSQRTVLHDDIVHYTFDVDLGPAAASGTAGGDYRWNLHAPGVAQLF